MDLPGVDLIEQGHHDECVEDHGEVDRGRISQLWKILNLIAAGCH